MIRVGFALGLTAVGAVVSATGPASWLNHQILSRIQFSGYRFLGYHAHTVDGDREAFNSLAYYGQGAKRFTDTGQITLAGRDVLGVLNFDATIVDSRFKDPQNQKINLSYRKGGWTVEVGDIYGSLLNTNQFVSMSKSLKGGSVQFKQGRLAAKIVRSDTKGTSRTVTLQGINSPGPYYLASSQVIQGTESVLLDGQEMVLGRDYVINYEIGSIEFIGRVIAPTSTILVTYEALDFNGTPGTVQGVGLSYDFGKAGRIGFSALEQVNRNRSGLSSRLEQFEGFGAAGTPYFLQFEPLSTAQYPTTIRVNGILQTENVDYRFDATNKSIFYFNRFVPSTSIIEVVYFPRPTSAAAGDRRVTGFDYRIPIGKDGSYLSYSQAVGELRSDTTPLKGTARGLRGVYKDGPWELSAGWRSVPDTFVTVESRGFNRNDKSVDLSAKYTSKGFSYGATHNNAAVSTRTVDREGNTKVNAGRQTQARAFAGYSAESWSWNVEQARRTVSSVRGHSRLDTTSLTMSRSLGRTTARFGLDHQTGVAPNSEGIQSGLGLDSARLDVDYRVGRGLNVGLRSSLSSVKFDGSNGRGHDLGLNAVYRPSERWLFEGSYTNSNSGQLATLSGFEGSLGYDGNGFSSGAIGSAFSAGTTQLRVWNLHARYESGSRTTLDFRVTNSLSSGSLYTNTDSRFIGVGLDYDLGFGHAFSIGLEQNDVRFLDSPNRSQTRSLTFGFSGRPKGPWSYRLGANAILSAGGPFSQYSLSLDGSLFYRIDQRQQAYATFSTGRTTGYLPQTDSYLGLFYEYRLWQNVSLIGSYKFRRLTNQDPNFLSGAYRSRGFDIELSFNFGS